MKHGVTNLHLSSPMIKRAFPNAAVLSSGMLFDESETIDENGVLLSQNLGKTNTKI